jgi:predicted Zn-dependent protease
MSGFGYGNGGYGSRGINLRWIIALVIAGIGLISYLTHTQVNPVTGEKQHIDMSVDQEKQLGLQAAPRMAQQMGGDVNPSDPAAREVAKIGRELVSRSDAGKSPYNDNFHYHLLNDLQTVNAFALPGGQIFITRALYDRLENEAQLAGVLGHETGHVINRHSAQQMAKGKLGQMLVVATGVGASGDRNGQAEQIGAVMAEQMLMLHYSRGDESQADEFGLKYMAQAGYDPHEMLGVMKILKSLESSGRTPEMLATHPLPQTRINQINELLSKSDYSNGGRVTFTRGQPLPGAGASAPAGSNRKSPW